MPNLLTTIQEIAVNAVKSTNPVEFRYGTVTNADPLKIRLSDSTIEISGDSIILTVGVVEKKITIKKHTHEIGSTIAGHTHSATLALSGTAGEIPLSGTASGTTSPTTDFNSQTEIVNTVVEAVCKEFGQDLPVDSNNDEITFTINRGLEKGDKVIMLKVSGGQRFIVLSRIFTRSDETEAV